MKPEIAVEIESMIKRKFKDEHLQRYLIRCVQEKADSIWSELTLYTHYMLGGDSPYIERYAALSELTVLALDIADDLQDQDNTDSYWMREHSSYALNAVLAFIFSVFSEFSRMYADGNSMHLVSKASDLLINAVNGQHQDLMNAVETEQQYMEMVQGKSASLIEFALYVGAASALGTDEHLPIFDTLHELAAYTGAAAQIENDRRDVMRWDAKNDLLYKRKTIPILFLLANTEEIPYIEQYYNNEINRQTMEEHKEEILAYIEQSGCLEYSQILQAMLHNKFLELIQTMPGQDPYRTKLIEVLSVPFRASL